MLKIREVLKDKGVTQRELADGLGVSVCSVAKTIVGNPPIGTLKKIADLAGVHVLDLIEDDRGGVTRVCPHCGKPLKIEIEKAK